MNRGLLALLFLISPFFAQGAPAVFNTSDSLNTWMDTLQLQNVVVTATRTPRMIKDVPVLTRVISSRDIALQGNVRIEDILSAEIAGLEFHQAGYGTTMSYQGLDARHILVLVDGERLSGEINGNIDFSRIPVESVERIEILKGSASVLYGSNAMGATINIITKNPDKDGVTASGTLRYGGLNRKEEKDEGIKPNIPNLTGSAFLGINKKNFTSRTDFSYQSSDPYRIVSKEQERRHYTVLDGKPVDRIIYVPIDSSGISVSGWQLFSVSEKLGYTFSKKFEAEVRGSFYTKDRYDLEDYTELHTEGHKVPDQFERIYGYGVDGVLTYNINDRNSLTLQIHDNVSYKKEISEGIKTPKQRHEFFIPQLIYRNERRDKKNLLTAGIEVNYEWLNQDLSATGYDKRYHYTTFSFYAQDEVKLFRNLNLTAGIRFINYGCENAKEFFSNFTKNKESDQRRGVIATPKVAVTYVLPRMTLRANYSMGFRTPSLKERFMEYYQPYMGMTIVGNPDLKPEINNYFSLSGEYFAPSRKLMLTANVYVNCFRDKIDTYQDNEKQQLIYRNTSKSTLTGVDLSGQLKLLKGWWLRVNYAFIFNNEEAPTNSAQYIFTSPHTATLMTDYSFDIKKFRLAVNLSGRYLSAKEYEDRMPTIIRYEGSLIPEVIEGTYTARMEGYMLWNVAVSCTYGNRYRLMVGSDNLLGYTPPIAAFNAALTPGRTFFVSFRFNFR